LIRIAAVGDVHYDRNSKDRMKIYLERLAEKADLLFIAGDLTQSGAIEEAEALADDLENSPVPVVIVLGNHDYQQNKNVEILELLRARGFTALEGESARFEIQGKSVGVVGLKGFGGGFFGACVTEFGEPETKAFAHFARLQAEILDRELSKLDTDYRFVLLHFSPIEATLLGEKREIYPFLGSYLLAEAIDSYGADAIFHGHAHMGSERGFTPGGIPVRNVAQPVIRHAYNIYHFDGPHGIRTDRYTSVLQSDQWPKTELRTNISPLTPPSPTLKG
jgi:Icc-related predicted phosphoesterase